MRATLRARHENADILAAQLCRREAKEALGGEISAADPAPIINENHRIRCGVHQCLQLTGPHSNSISQMTLSGATHFPQCRSLSHVFPRTCRRETMAYAWPPPRANRYSIAAGICEHSRPRSPRLLIAVAGPPEAQLEEAE